MPRLNRPRTIGAEANLATRIRYERQRRDRGWSPERLAQELTAAGCPIATSAIYKIEAGNRQVTVDELAAMARVFDTSTDDLLRPVEVVQQERGDALLARLRANGKAFSEAISERVQIVAELREVALQNGPDSEIVEYLANTLTNVAPPVGERVAVRVDLGAGGRLVGVPTGEITERLIRSLDSAAVGLVGGVNVAADNSVPVVGGRVGFTRDRSPIIFPEGG